MTHLMGLLLVFAIARTSPVLSPGKPAGINCATLTLNRKDACMVVPGEVLVRKAVEFHRLWEGSILRGSIVGIGAGVPACGAAALLQRLRGGGLPRGSGGDSSSFGRVAGGVSKRSVSPMRQLLKIGAYTVRDEPGAVPVPLSSCIFVCFDTETTGLNKETDRIIELAAAKFSIRGGIISTFHSLVDPGRPIENSFIHGINDSIVQGAPKVRKKFSAPNTLPFGAPGLPPMYVVVPSSAPSPRLKKGFRSFDQHRKHKDPLTYLCLSSLRLINLTPIALMRYSIICLPLKGVVWIYLYTNFKWNVAPVVGTGPFSPVSFRNCVPSNVCCMSCL